MDQKIKTRSRFQIEKNVRNKVPNGRFVDKIAKIFFDAKKAVKCRLRNCNELDVSPAIKR
jgi:hypothetical protein